MKQRSISEIFFKLPYELSEAERKTQILLLIPFGLLSNLLITYIFIGILIGTNFIPFFMAFSLIIIGIIAILHYWDKLQEKYGMRPLDPHFSFLIRVMLLFYFLARLHFSSDVDDGTD